MAASASKGRAPGVGAPPARRQLGLDPGYGHLGYALVESRGSQWSLLDVGVVETSKALAFERRLLALHAEVLGLCRRWGPSECALETLYFSKNAKTAMQVAEARGVLRLSLAQAGVPVFEVAPNAVKSAVAGDGAATKAQVGRMVVRLLGLKALPKPDDAADAAAIAIAGLRSAGLRRLQAKMARAAG